MINIGEISQHFLSMVADADREKNTESIIQIEGGRRIYFWLADNFGSKLGISSYEVDQVVDFLSKRDLLYWRQRSVRTVELTDRGFRWEYHKSLFTPPYQELSAVTKQITIINSNFANSPIDSENVTLDSYIEKLEIGNNSSEEERELKELLVELRRNISQSNLKSFEKSDAIKNIDHLTHEISLPPSKREEGALLYFFNGIKNVISTSNDLVSLVTKLASLLGLS